MYKNNSIASFTKLGLATAICGIFHVQPAVAQVEELLEEVTVTAQFRKQNLQDTPLSITALTADMMTARNQTSIEDVAAQAPNVNLNTMGGAFGPSIGSFIRGVGQYDFNPAYEPGVGMYVDDVYYPSLTGANFDLLDLERVEILRGPQGTLTGRNSIGGAIKLFSRKPQGDDGGFIEAAYGSRHRMDIRAGADFTLTDTLFGRVSGVYKRQDGFVSRVDYGCANPGNPEGIASTRAPGDCTVDKMGDEGYSGLRASLRYTPSDVLDIMLTADFTDVDRNGTADVVTVSDFNPNYICGDRCNYINYQNVANNSLPPGTLPSTSLPTVTMPSNVTFQGEGWSLNADWKLSETLQLQSITAYRRYNTTWGTDDDFTPDKTITANGYNDIDHTFFSQEFRLNGSMGESVNYTVGAYYSDQKTVYATLQDIRYLPPIPPLNNGILQFMGDDPVTADAAAIFGTLMVSVTEQLSVTAGLRYTEESKDYKFVRLNWDGTENAPIVGMLNGLVAPYEGDEVDYRLTLDYRFNDAFMLYGSASTGFKGGGVTARPFTPGQAINGAFDPEKIVALELGVKSNPFENATLNVALFRNDYQDKQMPIIDCSELDGFSGAPCAAQQNAGDGVISGFEAEFTAVFGAVAVDAAFSYISDNWDYIDPKVGGTYQDSDPMAFLTPEKKLTVGLQYDFDLGNAGEMYTRIDATYKDEIFTDRAIGSEPNFFPSTTVVNARVAWRNAKGNLDVALQVTNLTDEDILLTRFASVYSFTGTAYTTLGDPREWALTVKRSF